jgi:hypothetical protein
VRVNVRSASVVSGVSIQTGISVSSGGSVSINNAVGTLRKLRELSEPSDS